MALKAFIVMSRSLLRFGFQLFYTLVTHFFVGTDGAGFLIIISSELYEKKENIYL